MKAIQKLIGSVAAGRSRIEQAQRWGIKFALEDTSPLGAEKLLRFMRIAAELPIELHRVGWSSIGIPRQLQDTLAGHHHQVTLLTLLTEMYLTQAGCDVDGTRMIEMSGTHDVSEWAGGDAGVKRAKQDHRYKQSCRIIEEINRQKLVGILENNRVAQRYIALTKEEMEQSSDEAVIVKLIDCLEALLHLRRVDPRSDPQEKAIYADTAIYPQLERLKNEKTKHHMRRLVNAFVKLDREDALGRVELTEKTTEYSPEEKMISVWNRLQMMKHVERTAWAVAGLPKDSMDTLAEHGHVTTIGVWTLITALEEIGLKMDMRKAIGIALVQEVGKMHGGDVAIESSDPKNQAREAAYYIRKANFQLLFEPLPRLLPQLTEWHNDGIHRQSDEAKLMMTMSRVLDYLHYDLVHHPSYGGTYRHHTNEKIINLARGMTHPEISRHVERAVKEMLMVVEKGSLRKSVHTLLPDAGNFSLK